MKKAASQPPFCLRDLDILLADVAPAVFALEPCTGLADEAVAGRIAVVIRAAVGVAVAPER